MKRITVLSGKGGVGKSMLSSSLLILLSRRMKLVAADCDVDAPDLGLTLGMDEGDYDSWKEVTTNEKAVLIPGKCTGCRRCVDTCAFGAIGWDEKGKRPVFKSLFCEGCGACSLVCPAGAIRQEKVKNAKIGSGRSPYGFPILTGQLRMGESGSGKVIFMLKDMAEKAAEKEGADVVLSDAAAGIGCPVISSVRGSDYVVAVTEPTPSALSDLKRALETVGHFGIPAGLVINKFDINRAFSRRIEGFAAEAGISVLGKVPYDRRFVDALVDRKPAIIYDESLEPVFGGILEKLMDDIGNARRKRR
jgi:MinD superfamily P-loop ATPase